MKKVCSVLLVLLIALTSIFAFTACDNTGIEIEGLSQDAIFVGLKQIENDCDVVHDEDNPIVIAGEKHTMKAMSLTSFALRYGLGADAAQYASLVLRTSGGDKQIPLSIDSDYQVKDNIYIAAQFDGINGMFLVRPQTADYKIAFSKIYFSELRFRDFKLAEDQQNKKQNVKYVYSLENALRVAQFKTDMDKELAKPEDERKTLILEDYYARPSQSMTFEKLSATLPFSVNPTDPMFFSGTDSSGLQTQFVRKHSVYAGATFYSESQKSSFLSDDKKFSLSDLEYALAGNAIFASFDKICAAVVAAQNTDFASLSAVMEYLGVDNDRHIKPVFYNTSKNTIEEGDYIYSQNLEDYTFRKSERGEYTIYDELGNNKYDFVGFKYYY